MMDKKVSPFDRFLTLVWAGSLNVKLKKSCWTSATFITWQLMRSFLTTAA